MAKTRKAIKKIKSQKYKTIEEYFDSILQTVCTDYNCAWWDVIEDEKLSKQLDRRIARYLKISIDKLEFHTEYIQWMDDCIADI